MPNSSISSKVICRHYDQNSANDFVFFARRGEMSSNRREDHEISMLSLHLLQNCMMFMNTLMLQQVLCATTLGRPADGP